MYKLEDVVSAFELWRVSRVSRREPIPDKLWDMVKELIPHYKKAAIQKALKVSGGQFNHRCGIVVQKTAVPVNDGFAVGLFSPGDVFQNSFCEITLKGMQRNLQIKLPINHISHVLSLMEGYL